MLQLIWVFHEQPQTMRDGSPRAFIAANHQQNKHP